GAARGVGRDALGRRRGLDTASARLAALANRQGAPRNLRRAPWRRGRTPRHGNALGEPRAGRGLDGDRAAGDNRGRHPLGQPRRRAPRRVVDRGPAKRSRGLDDYARLAQMTAAALSQAELEASTAKAASALLGLQRADGHFVFELEADATIPAEYILFTHWRGETPDLELERKIGNYLRRIQGAHGGWPLFHEGRLNVSASVKAYFALKMIGDDPRAPHMLRAREAILAHGGAAQSNVFTRTLLALYGAAPWRAVPVMPVEIMLLPRWFPFHIAKISYWARTVLVPLTLLYALRPIAKNPRRVGVPELFHTPPERIGRWPKGPHQRFPWSQIFAGVDRLLRLLEPAFPAAARRRAIDRATEFTIARLNRDDGI